MPVNEATLYLQKLQHSNKRRYLSSSGSRQLASRTKPMTKSGHYDWTKKQNENSWPQPQNAIGRRGRLSFSATSILMRDTGMSNERELYQIRIENINWDRRTIFVPDSKTINGVREVPLSDRALDLLRVRCGLRKDCAKKVGCSPPSVRHRGTSRR